MTAKNSSFACGEKPFTSWVTLGTGGAGEYRQDQVTVYLRAVSTQSGRVLKSVHTTKTIVSQRVQGNLFRFVDLQRLLEAEIGYSYNEPPVLAVTEAIEEAVRALIIEGLRENLWAAAENVDPAQLRSGVPRLATYLGTALSRRPMSFACRGQYAAKMS